MSAPRGASAISAPEEADEKPKPKVKVPKPSVAVVDTDWFSTAMAVVVVVNVIMIGLETELPGNEDLFSAINNGFLLAYIIELLMRMLTHGIKSLSDPFTVMDLILVLLAFLERALSSAGFARALPTFRMLRLVRIFRSSRIFQHSKELAAIAAASVKMFRTLLWVLMILLIFLWCMATFAHVVIGRSAEWNGTLDPNKDFPPFTPFDIRQYFGTVYKSFITLLQVVTLSQWAPHIARPIIKVYPALFVFFVMFLFVTTYGLLICIISNLVQESIATSKSSAKAREEAKLEERRNAGRKAQEIMKEIDADGSGELCEAELAYALQATDLEQILLNLGVPVVSAPELICLLDHNGNGEVSYEELVSGVVRMEENITKRDFAMIGFWLKNLLMRTEHLESRLGKLCDEISFIRQRLSGSFGSLNHMIRTAEDSQLRQRALHTIRTTGHFLPPPLYKPVIVKPTIAKQDQGAEFMSFTSRFLGQAPEPRRPRPGSPGAAATENAPRTTALFRNTMGPAPPRVDVGRRLAKEAELNWKDQYAMADVRQNPKFGALKRLI